MKKTIIIALDVGAKGAVVVKNAHTREIEHEFTMAFKDSLLEVYRNLEDLAKLYSGDDIVFVMGEAMGRPNVIKKHAKFYGVIEMLAEEIGAAVYYCIDVSARKIVLPDELYRYQDQFTASGSKKVKKGKDAKQAVMDHYGKDNSDIADAHLFADWFIAQSIISQK